SLVAVDCETGERRWHFQMVHHGLWDYDLPTSAIIGDIEVEGRRIRAAMQLSKQGFLYVFDAGTGEPVWPILEREVPQTGIVGERTSPTQPFPTRPPAFERQGLGPDDLIDFTPELRGEAMAILSQYQYGPIFTPPTERGTFLMPGYGGGASWPGGAFDPETGMLYVPSFTWPVVNTLRKPDPSRSSFDYVGRITSDVRGPRDLPLVKPPYSRITAYDMNAGEIAWTVPLGYGPRRHPALADLDLPALGSGARGHVVATRTLLFVTSGRSLAFRGVDREATAGGAERDDWRIETPALRAFDKATGGLVGEIELPAHTDGSPITFLHRGRQYLVFALGGRGAPFELIAYRPPA
ncbi:MAG: pyrroloquinoline quinone-dependent dehydrogenase, partial [Acidobacteriota bacterium]|nr:pyrroloquinoline quinone-dependent dehydrogenase [Acidobacteriota bacterium]